jgi:hypothetical protein
MNDRTRLTVMIAAIALTVAILAVALAQCGARPAPAAETPGVTVAATMPTDIVTEDPGPTSTPGPTPTPTLTAEELLARELIEPRGQVTFSADECSQILETEPWCVVINSATHITRPEWDELFLQTDFFLVKVHYRPQFGHDAHQGNWLIVEQDSQRYTADTFDRLLAANGITEITDGNRELIAKAFALMTIPDYLGDEVIFIEWEEGDWPDARHHYSHSLKAWTKIQGLEIKWWFVFEDGWLKIITRGGISKYHTGDYIDTPFEILPLPPLKDYYFSP